MTRETKVGLLIGLGLILLVGIILSDTLSIARHEPAGERVGEFGPRAQESIHGPGETDPLGEHSGFEADAGVADRAPTRPIPSAEDLDRAAPWPAEQQDSVAIRLPQAFQREAASAEQSEAEPAPQPSSYTRMQELRDRLARLERQNSEQAAAGSIQIGGTPAAEVRSNQPIRIPTQQAQPRRVARTRTHTVASGENLTVIARQYFDGDGSKWRLIAKANPDKVSSNGGVRAGAELVIPAEEVAPSATSQLMTSLRRAMNADGGQAQQSRTIKVESGDTLSTLAQKHLGTSRRWPELLEANRDQLPNERALRAGMELKLPTGSETTAAAREDDRPATGHRRYTVRENDSLASIAARTMRGNGDWRDLYAANRDRIADPNVVPVGLTLVIPE